MDRYGVTERSRAAILAELDQLGRDRLAHGKEARAREYARAWHVINDGGDEVTVGHAVYRVVEDSPADGEMPPTGGTGLAELLA